MKSAVLLFAHGARSAVWARPFEVIAQRVAQERPGQIVRLAFLELMQPGLLESAHEVVAQGCRRVHVIPLVLGAGNHVREDLPRLVDGLRQAHPDVAWLLSPPIGEIPEVIDGLTRAVLALADATPPTP
jgi:sirohydrochlorin cobaltochelatase